MTNQEEERQLLRDAETAQRDSERIGQMRLDEAVRAGIGQGKKRAARRKAVYGTGFAAAAAAAILALSPALMPGPGAAPTPQNVTAGVPQASGSEEAKPGYENIKDYRSSGTDMKYFNALKSGYVASLSESQTQGDYTVTLKGVAMDDRSMYLIAELKNDTSTKARFSKLVMDFGSEYPVSWVSMAADSVPPGASRKIFLEYQLDSRQPYPGKANFRAEVYGGEFGQPEGKAVPFDIPFELNTQDLADQIHTVEVGRDLEVDGQKIKVERIEISPLATYVDYRYEKTNDKKIFELLDPKVKLDGKFGSDIPILGREYESKDGLHTMVFAASKIQDVIGASLTVQGISAIKPEDLKLVVNTETGEIIQGGDSSLSVLPDKEKGTVTFRRELASDGEDGGFSHPTEFENTFTDAAGVVHDWPLAKEGYTEGTGSQQTQSEVYEWNGSNIVQPITLTMKNYWAPIKEKAELELLDPAQP